MWQIEIVSNHDRQWMSKSLHSQFIRCFHWLRSLLWFPNVTNAFHIIYLLLINYREKRLQCWKFVDFVLTEKWRSVKNICRAGQIVCVWITESHVNLVFSFVCLCLLLFACCYLFPVIMTYFLWSVICILQYYLYELCNYWYFNL